MTKPHANATSIHKGAYAQDADPGAVGAHKLWVDTTGGVPPYPLKKRNAANSGWEAVGSTGGMTNPMTTSLDMIVAGSAGAPGRLGVGAGGAFMWVEPSVGPAWGLPLDIWNGTIEGQLLTVHDGVAEFVIPIVSDSTHEGGVRIHGTPTDATHPVVPVLQSDGKIPSDSYVSGGDVNNGGNAYGSIMTIGTMDNEDFGLVRDSEMLFEIEGDQITLSRYTVVDLLASERGDLFAADFEIDLDADVPFSSYALGGSSIVLPGASAIAKSVGVFGNSSYPHDATAAVDDLVGLVGDLYFSGTTNSGGSVGRAIAVFGHAANGGGTTPITKAIAIYGELNTKGGENWSGYFEGDVNTQTGYSVGGTQVVGAQQTDVANAASANAPTQSGAYVQADVQAIATLCNELKTQLNAALAVLRAHGLMA